MESNIICIVYVYEKQEIWIGLEDGSIVIMNILGEIKFTMNAHSRKVNCMKQCTNKIWSGSTDGSMKVWDINTRGCMKFIETGAPVLLFTTGFDNIFSLSSSGKLSILDGETYNQVYEVPRKVNMGVVTNLSILPVIDNGKVVGKNVWLCSSDCIVSIWKIISSSAYRETD